MIKRWTRVKSAWKHLSADQLTSVKTEWIVVGLRQVSFLRLAFCAVRKRTTLPAALVSTTDPECTADTVAKHHGRIAIFARRLFPLPALHRDFGFTTAARYDDLLAARRTRSNVAAECARVVAAGLRLRASLAARRYRIGANRATRSSEIVQLCLSAGAMGDDVG